MAEFWEQQLMDRILALAFEFRASETEVLPTERIKEVVDYVKFLLKQGSFLLCLPVIALKEILLK